MAQDAPREPDGPTAILEPVSAFNGSHTVLAAILEPIEPEPEPIPPKVIPQPRPRCPECNVRFGVAHLSTCPRSSHQKAKAVAPKPAEPKIKMVPLETQDEARDIVHKTLGGVILPTGGCPGAPVIGSPGDSAPAMSHSEMRDTAKSADGRVPIKVPNHELELWSMRNVRDTLAPHSDEERARIVDWALVVLESKLSRIAAIGDHP